MLDGVETGGYVIGSHPAFIVSEGHIDDPVQAVLDRPMTAHDQSNGRRWQAEGGDMQTRLFRNDTGDFSDVVDHDNVLQSWPGMPFLEPSDVVDHGRCPRLDAAVIGIDGFVTTGCCILEISGFLFSHERLDVIVQAALSAFLMP
jgi:hypothetical protein